MTLDNQHAERVRGAFAALTDAAPLGVEFDELNDIRSTFQSGDVGLSNRRRGWLVALVSAVTVFVLVGGVALLSGQAARPAQQSTPTTQSTETTMAQVTETTLAALPLEALGAESVELIVVEATVVPSVVGDFRVTTVQTDTRFAPGGLVATPFGFGSVSVDGSHLLVSEDAIEWFAAPSPFTGLLVLRPPFGLTGDDDIGYTVRTEDRDHGDLQWYSSDFIQWVPVDPPTAGPTDSPVPPSVIRYEVDKLPPLECFEQDENACGRWFSLDSGWVFGYGPGIQGGVTIPDWASADGVNWERVEYDRGWDTMNFVRVGSFFGGSAGNVNVTGVTSMIPDPSDTPASAWFWVTQLP